MRLWGIIFCLSFFYCATVASQENPEQRAISVNASVCEKIINGESKSSARVRATDKASFKAVEEIPELSRYKESMDNHHFNLKIYRLVDNYLEDIKINTPEQTDYQVCTEVSAFLSPAAITEVFSSDAEDSSVLSTDEQAVLSLEIEDDISENINIAIPPRPEIVINKDIAYEEDAAVSAKPQATDKTVVFIDKTEFYNGTSTGGFFAHLEQALLNKPGIRAAAESANAAYILKSKVLKARVDNINTQTGRLQIVVALELTNTSSSETITEHQNRFVLFNTNDDMQTAAADLTKKLLSEGVAKLLPRIKTSAQSDGSIITPS